MVDIKYGRTYCPDGLSNQIGARTPSSLCQNVHRSCSRSDAVVSGLLAYEHHSSDANGPGDAPPNVLVASMFLSDSLQRGRGRRLRLALDEPRSERKCAIGDFRSLSSVSEFQVRYGAHFVCSSPLNPPLLVAIEGYRADGTLSRRCLNPLYKRRVSCEGKRRAPS